jgi:hypothetical protein
MDKVMKRLGIELVTLGSKVVPTMHCNADGRPVGGGRTSWLTAFRGYALKLNPAIDDIRRQPIEEMEAIKDALDQQFEYLNYPLAYKHVKDQVAIVLKGRRGYLRKKIKAGTDRPWNCPKLHWNQLKEALALEENVASANKMIRIRGMQKTTSCIGCVSEIGLEERLVNLIRRFQMLGFHVHQIFFKSLFFIRIT